MSKPILRLERVATRQAVASMGRHWFRTQPTPNADLHMPDGMRLLHGSGNVLADVDAILETLNKPPRKDACLAIEVLCSASEDHFRPESGAPYSRDPARVAAWVEATMTHLRAEHGDNLAAAVLHQDEQTPHIQAVLVPVVSKMRAPAGRAKDRTPRLTRTLSADTVMGNKATLSGHQDRYETVMATQGIGPRTRKEPEAPPRTTVNQWYARQEQATRSIEHDAELTQVATRAAIVDQTRAATERVAATRERAMAAVAIADAAQARTQAMDSARLAQEASLKRDQEAQAARAARLEAERAAIRQKALTTTVEATLDGRITGAKQDPQGRKHLTFGGVPNAAERAALAEEIRPAGGRAWSWVSKYFERTDQERTKIREQVRQQTINALERPRQLAAALAIRLRKVGRSMSQVEREEAIKGIAEATTVAPRAAANVRSREREDMI